MATIEDFEKLDIRVGKVLKVENFPEAHKPSYKMKIDFGAELGVKKSCAQLPANYSKEELTGMLVVCVVNFPVRQIGPAVSEVLTLGFPDDDGNATLVTPTKNVPLGGKLF